MAGAVRGGNNFFNRMDRVLEKEANESGGQTTLPQQTTVPQQTTTKPQQTTLPAAQGQQTTLPQQTTQSQQSTIIPSSWQTTQHVQSQKDLALQYLKENGIDVSDISELQTRLNTKPLSEEEKKIQTQKREQAILSRFIETGKGTLDDFHGIRSLKDMKDEDLVKADFQNKMEVIDPSLKDEDVDELFNEQYFIGKEGTFSAYEVKLGQQRLKAEADAIRATRSAPLSKIEQELNYHDEAIQERKNWETKVEQFAATQMPKEFIIPLGKMGTSQTDLGDFTYKLSEDEQKEFVANLKDPAFIVKEISDESGKGTDLSKLTDLLVWRMIAKKMIKASAYENYSKGIEAVGGKLDNYPNLNNGGSGAQNTDEQQDVQKGQQQIKEDSRVILGKKHHRKSLISS